MAVMIHVLAFIRVKSGSLDAFVKIFKANVPNVLAEEECMEYTPAIDVPAGIPVQNFEPDLVTVIEKWQSVEALRAHLAAPHMLAYKEAVRDLILSVEVKILQEA